jgi:glycerophosphoryl diester phosphodiesterase
MTLVIAHRGASRTEPENTVAAFRRAVEIGADGIELDVRRTADNQLVIHHDPRLSDGRVISRASRADLPESIPTFDEALDACEGAFVNIEIKNDANEPDFDPNDWVARAIAVQLLRRRADTRWLISSFRLETVNACRRLLPGVRTGWLVEQSGQAEIDTTRANGHQALHPWVATLTEPTVRAAHHAGIAVNTWTCDDPDRIRELIAWGVNGICTNLPDLALAVRGELLGSGR